MPNSRIGLTALLLIGLVWGAAVNWLKIPEYLLPAPLDVARYVTTNFPLIAEHAGWTVLESLAGLCAAFATALLLAILFIRVPLIEQVCRPLLVTLQSMPILAIAPLLTTWFGSGFFSKFAAAALVCLPAIVVTIYDGLSRIRADEIELYSSMGATPWQTLLYLRLPRAVPALFTSLRLAIPLAFLGAIVGEFVGSTKGLGFLILSSSYYLRTTEMFAAIIAGSLICLCQIKAMDILEKAFGWNE